jgi:hypothetical protein
MKSIIALLFTVVWSIMNVPNVLWDFGLKEFHTKEGAGAFEICDVVSRVKLSKNKKPFMQHIYYI